MDSSASQGELWKTVGRQSLLSAPPWLEVFREQILLPSGRVIQDFYQIVLPEFVTIVPWTPEGRLLLVRGYKHGVGRINLSPPAGLIEQGETPLETAQRELLEETGHAAERWNSLGRFVIDGNRGCGAMHLFTAHGIRSCQAPKEDDGEDLHLVCLSREEALEALRRGEIGNLAGAGGLSIALSLTQL